MKDSLSALLDGECSDSELGQFLAEMERNPALRQRFSRQCLVREARMGTRVRASDFEFSSRVLAALQDEPAVVVPFGDRVRRLPWRAAASLAAAAAVGAVAVLVTGPRFPAAAPGVPVAEAPVAVATPVAAEPAEEFAKLDDEYERQLRNYMLAYSQSRGQQSVRGMLGYARYAAYDDTQAAPQTTEAKR
ncbi:MAG: sigma-E factor negative regulatory protein [Nevskiaceae bacterium]